MNEYLSFGLAVILCALGLGLFPVLIAVAMRIAGTRPALGYVYAKRSSMGLAIRSREETIARIEEMKQSDPSEEYILLEVREDR